MTESRPLQVPDPDAQLKGGVAQELKRCWLTKIGSRNDIRGIVVDDSGVLNKELLRSLVNTQTLIAHCLQDGSLDLEQPEVMYLALLGVHPPEPQLEYSRVGKKRTVEELGLEEKAWAIGVMMRLLKDYPDKSYGNDDNSDWTSGRQRYAAHILWINPRQLYDSEDPNNSSRSLREFLTAYIEHLIKTLTNPDIRDRVIEAAQAKMQELATRKPLGEAPVPLPRPDAPGPEVVDDPADVDPPAPVPEAAATVSPGKGGTGSRLSRYWKHLAAIGAVMVIVIGGAIVFVHRGSGSGHTSVVAQATTTSSGSTAPAVPGIPLSPGNVCENSPPAAAVGQVDVEICVEYWCTGDFHAANGIDTIPGRGQIKLRPLLFNKSPFAVDISITPNAAIRLLVATPKDPSVWWQPPPATAQAGDHPVPVTWHGQHMWAVPPNAPHDAVRIELPGNMYTYDGFATFWDYTTLGPGETAFKPLRFDDQHRAVQEGDLVFNVPLDDPKTSQVRALVLVDRNDPTKILASSDTRTWPKPSDLNSF